ncbi:MAG: apolipoprotein N-acyltransferase [Deltaproteobacteria bacterium]|nr:apolipoprotein N-acyltransferase [Deltaproteobacteria bacterium]
MNSRTISAIILSSILFTAPFLFPRLFPLAWVGLVPLFYVVERINTGRRAFAFGWLMGWLCNLLGFYWLVYTISVFGGFSYPTSVVVFLIFASLEALQFALFSLIVRRVGPGLLNLFPALFWVGIEYWFPHLFPWQVANTQIQFLTLIQSADIIGLYGTSFLVVWLNTIVYGMLFRHWGKLRQSLVSAALFAVVLLGAIIYGAARLPQVSAESANAVKLTLAAVQGNIDIDLKWNPAQWSRNLKSYQDLTSNARDAALVIWPESAYEPWLPENNHQLPPELRSALPPESSFFIFGARSYSGRPETSDFKAFNSAFLADNRGRILSGYHKQVLMAFGEYIPFSTLLAQIPGVPKLESFSRGDAARTLDFSGGIRVAPLICYEDLMPELARAFVRQSKANLLVNLTNDAWYGNTVAPWQHARLAQWRAIETRRYLVRATNTGVTAVIDPTGAMVEALPTFSPGILSSTVSILEGETLYVRFGDWFAWLVSGVSVVIFLSVMKRSK